jgi:regulatory protein
LTTATLKLRALRLLARREYSRPELEERLAIKGASRAEIGPLLDELEALGYLSNDRYARSVVAQKAGQFSRRSIAATLKAKGVGGDAVAAAMAEVDIDDAVALEVLWRRRFGSVPRNEREKARQVRFLQTRGFALSAILKLLRNEGG